MIVLEKNLSYGNMLACENVIIRAKSFSLEADWGFYVEILWPDLLVVGANRKSGRMRWSASK